MNVLKKISMFFMLVILASCGNDDDANTNVAASIAGTWKVVSYVSDGEEYVTEGSCLDKYLIAQETARFVESFLVNEECVTQVNNNSDYPSLPYTYDGSTFICGGLTFYILEADLNTIKWYYTFEEDGDTYTEVETLERE